MKLMLVCTSGGHFATMKSLKSFWSLHDRVWVSDRKKDTASLEQGEKVHWLPYQAPRDILALLLNIPETFRILVREKPDVVISTGASLAINFAFIGKLLGIKFVFIESISRSQELSVSGKLVYLIADEFYVQWPELCEKYDKVVFRGYVS
ncbi:PssD/Cps14F family polysaccharide biosynthesis glycosyltransferase [Calothrix sp. PCC 7507]|uniref:PssD/Cps14F family polysaccharide biosynthesis glycosyltransferase n=1 Tax=Calothrix sp. PCC 7507 TaxID=99598 RepID=UPI00029F0A0D|nr:PssD/Cps14F family polysaccharide biosynthesis glycosyltransferase [Calothrix sp. PCC 7507]AFY32493.1 Oligosaccharide biosynthesis protein Alg14 like protein [Calothrix sp. PCC 7507]